MSFYRRTGHEPKDAVRLVVSPPATPTIPQQYAHNSWRKAKLAIQRWDPTRQETKACGKVHADGEVKATSGCSASSGVQIVNRLRPDSFAL